MKVNFFAIIITFVIGYAAIMIFLGNIVNSEVDSHMSRYKSMMGEEIVIKSDTLTAIDYSIIDGTIMFDNGVEYNIDYIEKLKK